MGDNNMKYKDTIHLGEINHLPKVSIMIPCYNQENYIEEAISSALSQDYGNLEIVISDDCSSDGTSSVIRKFLPDARIKYHRNDKNIGRVANYHRTLYCRTTGDWIINLDGDDFFIDNGFISKSIGDILKAKGMQQDIVAYGYDHSIIFRNKKIKFNSINGNKIISGKDYFLHYADIGEFSHMGTLYRKDYAVKLGDLYTKKYQASDFQSLIKIILQGNIILSSIKIGHWRTHGNNATILEVDKKMKQAKETFDDLEVFSRRYFSVEELSKWRKSMDRAAYHDYVSTRIYFKRDAKSFLLLLRAMKFKYSYLRMIIRFIFNI